MIAIDENDAGYSHLELIDDERDGYDHHVREASPTPVVPHDLDETPPGPPLARALASLDIDLLPGHDRVIALRAHQRMVSHHQAAMYRAMVAITEAMSEREGVDLSDPGDSRMDEAATFAAQGEIQIALGWSRRLAESELFFAIDLFTRLPAVYRRLERGVIDVRRAKAIHGATLHLPEDAARTIAAEILPEAPRLTTGQITARIAKRCIQLDPDDAKQRHDSAHAERKVVMHPTTDGTADLIITDLSPDRASAATRHLTWLAKGVRTKGDTRAIDQIRADIAIDLLTGAAPSPDGPAGRPHGSGVDIRVDLTTLAKLDENPAELAGYGPVISDIARQVASDSTDSVWRWTTTHPDTGLPIASGTTRRRPTRRQGRAVTSRHPTCVFPGCRMPSSDCDLDHRKPWSRGGPTTTDNLAPLCRHHHRLKDEAGFSYQFDTQGAATWTTPLGHTSSMPRPPP